MTDSPVVQVVGPHAAFIQNKLPGWIKHSHPSHIQRLRAGLFAGHIKEDQPPAWFTNAAPGLREALVASQVRSRAAHAALAKTLKGFQGVAEFAEPKLVAALHEAGYSAIDVNKNCLYYLRRDQPVHEQSLLQAALLNFEGNEDFSQVVGGATSVIAPAESLVTDKAGLTDEWVSPFSSETQSVFIQREKVDPQSTEGNRYRFKQKLSIAPQAFAQLCRTLDLGQQYQEHLSSVFAAPATRERLRQQMIIAQKEQMAVRLYAALMTGDVKAGYEGVSGLLERVPNPQTDSLVFSELVLLGYTIGQVLIIESASSYPIRNWADEQLGLALPAVRFGDPGPAPVVVYIPGAPISPLKEYSSLRAFEEDLVKNLCSAQYQQFFAGLVPQGKQQDFLKRLNYQLIDKPPTPGSKEQPIFFDASTVNLRFTQQTLQPQSGDIFATLYTKQIDRIRADALALAVPTAVVDWTRTQEIIASCLSIGMNVLNVAAFFVPGLGEVMMAVMALQLAKEVYDGLESWSVGDIDGAWSHLESVAVNLAFMGVMGGAGYAFSKIPAGTIPRILQELMPAFRPTGEVRLCKPELGPYQHSTQLLVNVEPNALGQYQVNGRTYLEVDQHVYEQTYDQQLNKWKLKHPGADNPFEPTLEHNNAGAWRHAHERPLEWGRAKLLRRLGHETRMFDDLTLGRIGDVSGVSDDVLREIHMEGLPAPALLLDTLELFRGDQEFADAVHSPPKNLFKRAANVGKGSASIEVQVLRNRFAALSERSIQEVLGYASSSELAGMRESATVPRRIDDLARGYVQQGRLNRAIAGLCKPSLSCLDSERLALHGLEHLPGWPDDIQLQIRANNSRGRLLDSIGMERDPIRQCLIKAGEHFFVADAAGNPEGPRLSLYESILRVLPAQTREALGFADIAQANDLQRALARHAFSNRAEAAQILHQRIPRSRPFLGLINGRVGYALSARVEGIGIRDLQVVRLRDVYPQMNDEQALNYIEARIGQGITNQQIFDALEQQLNELQGLRSTLQSWSSEGPFRSACVERIIACWRSGLPYNLDADISLDLGGVSQLPVWEANFSHVRALNMDSALLISEPGTGFLQRFPNVRCLELFVREEHLAPLAESLPALAGVTELSLTQTGNADFSQTFLDGLSALSQLEELSVRGGVSGLDVSHMSGLRRLSIVGNLAQWPEGVIQLEHLEWLDLRHTSIATLPDVFFENPQRLFPSLRLNWSAMKLETVIRAYDFLSTNPAYAAEVAELVSTYVRDGLSVLAALTQAPVLAESVIRRALRSFSPIALMRRVSQVSEECRTLVVRLEQWKSQFSPNASTHFRQTIAQRLMDCWRSGVAGRLELEGDDVGVAWKVPQEGAKLDLDAGDLTGLPRLAQSDFNHVKYLSMNEVIAPFDELNSFLKTFENTQAVALGRNQLLDFPSALAQMPQLRSLDLRYNALRVTPHMQQCLNSLGMLERLDLSGNWVDELDVSSLPELQQLNLSSTAIQHWPTAIVQCRSLDSLDLSFSAITDIPSEVMQHQELLGKTQLQGCRLTRESCNDLLAYALKNQRTDAGAISLDMLAEGTTGGEPASFPIQVSDNPDLLLSEPIGVAHDDPPLTRLQRLNPDLTLTQATARLEQIQARAVSIEARLSAWEHELSTITSRLNSWIASRSYRVDGGRRWVNTVDRKTAADRILCAWRYSVGRSGGEVHTLDFSDLCIGGVPELPGVFDFIKTLNLSGTGLTQSEADTFILSFTHLRTLQLNNTGLSKLPGLTGGLQHLTKLEAAGNRLTQVDLQSMNMLELLDLSRNFLEEVNVQGLTQLHTLELSSNRLSEWPEGVFELPTLRVLKLNNNGIDEISLTAVNGQHDVLMAGTDLSGNQLPHAELRLLRSYRNFTGNNLGYSFDDLDIDGFDESSDESPDENSDGLVDTDTDEELPDVLPVSWPFEYEKEPWFQDVPADSPKHAVWDALRTKPNSQYFFRLLDFLQDSSDFMQQRPELTLRVWAVLDAANDSEVLCNELFSMARSRPTCSDGRMLVFSDIELRVYEFCEFGTGAAGKTGEELFRFYRGMYRLGKVEDIARVTINASTNADVAEVRLAYRTGLAKRLELPKQATSMAYDEPQVTPAKLEAAYEQIIAAEKTNEFLEQLITRDNWCNYLKAQYPQEIDALQVYSAERNEALEEQYAGPASEGYEEAANMARIDLAVRENELLLRLSERQRALFEQADD